MVTKIGKREIPHGSEDAGGGCNGIWWGGMAGPVIVSYCCTKQCYILCIYSHQDN